MIILIVFSFSDKDFSGYVNWATIAFAFAVLQFSSYIKLNDFCKRLFNFLGDLSYPLYLVHFPLAILLVAGFNVTSDLLFSGVNIWMILEGSSRRGLRPSRSLLVREQRRDRVANPGDFGGLGRRPAAVSAQRVAIHCSRLDSRSDLANMASLSGLAD